VLSRYGGSVPIISFSELYFLFLQAMKETETELNLLRRIERNPSYTQRKLSSDMVISLGKVNYCLRRLTEKGWVKVHNFHNSKNKSAYVYLFSPSILWCIITPTTGD